jgi:hypothetical protein
MTRTNSHHPDHIQRTSELQLGPALSGHELEREACGIITRECSPPRNPSAIRDYESKSAGTDFSDPMPSVTKINSRPRMGLSRRQLIATLAGAASVAIGERSAGAVEPEVRFDFTRPIEGWEMVSGKWTIEEVPGALRDGKALVQRATNNAFNVIVAPGGPYTNVDVNVRFKPMSGREDASGGVVLHFSKGHYYVIRANALEDNFNFYYYDPIRGRHQITGTRVKAPALGQWHKLRVTAEGDHIQGWLNNQRLVNYHDSRFTSGQIGLWTKADSITAFDDLVVRGL